jgi:hypothetical protein
MVATVILAVVYGLMSALGFTLAALSAIEAWRARR